MSLQPGTHLGPYGILSPIGAGGMGEVYRATDTVLKRDVAIKLLPEVFARDPERVARFKREAQLLASLNHPNIATIHGLHNEGNQYYLAMELVPGETLAERIRREGAVPIEESLDIATQICDALEHAHEKGIIHRDLKPANVKLTPEGKVKVLDFGLAKAFVGDVTSAETPKAYLDSNSPTLDPVRALTASPTLPGVILGTAAYMSPEQARGKAVDKRTDIFAFGCVLYELLTSQRAFNGETVSDILASVIKTEPDWSLLPAMTPPGIRALLRRCLQKDTRERFRDAGDVRLQMIDAPASVVAAPVAAALPVSSRRTLLYSAAAAIIIVAGAAWLLLRPRQSQQSAQTLQPVPLTTYEGDQRDPAFSPDGNQIAFSWGPEGGITNMYLRLVGPGDPIRLTNSPDAERMSQWSPDGKWIAFTKGNGIVAVPALGGPERAISATPGRTTWTPDSKFLLIQDGESLYLVPLQGGERKLLIGPLAQDGAKYSVGPGSVSPDGRTLALSYHVGNRVPLYFVPLGDGYAVSSQPRRATPEDWAIISWSWMPDGKAVIAVRDINGANSGGDTGMYRIDVSGGEPQRLDFAGDNPWFLDVARSGNRLAYTRLRRDVNMYCAELAPDGSLRGKSIRIASSSRREFEAAYSPDGSHIAFRSNRSGSDEIWIADRNGGTLVQLTNSANPDGTSSPAWSPDGAQIAFSARSAGAIASDIFVISATGGAPQRLTDDPAPDQHPSWSRDGKWIYFTSNRGGEAALWKVASTGGTATRMGSFTGQAAESPDGRWVYLVDARGITRIPASGGGSSPSPVLVQDSIAAGTFDVTGRGIYYLSLSQDLQSATLRLLPLEGGAPRTLGTINGAVTTGLSVAPDYSSILYSQCDQCAANIMLVENFK